MHANTYTILRTLVSQGQISEKLMRPDGSLVYSEVLDVRGATAFQFQYRNVSPADKYVIQGSAVQSEKDYQQFGLSDPTHDDLWVDIQEISQAEITPLQTPPNYIKGTLNGQQIYPWLRVKVEVAGTTSIMIHALRGL